ncbi:MAG: hypothetical protein L0271_26505 [Gemmatimonadetes bacterium]|nr:hypothetical protein [Gemmatimonadota bacterium]
MATGALAVALALPGPAAARAQDVPPDNPYLRWLYFNEIRAWPFDRVPPGALQAARRQMAQRWPDIISAARANRANVATAAAVWSPIGPAPITTGSSGRLTTIAAHPTNADVLYIGGAQGGVWKTTNGGLDWTPLTDGECSLAMGSIALDPANPDIVYAGTGELHFSGDSYYGCGVLRSTDAGVTWTQLGASTFDTNTGGARISKVIVDPRGAGSATTSTVYASSSFGVHKSTDSGVTWRRTLDGVATDLVQHATSPNTLWAALGVPSGNTANGVYRSDDGGETWVRQPTGFASLDVGRIALAHAPSTSGTLYAAVQDGFGGGGNDGRLLGVWKTTDGGANWVKLVAAGADCGTQCWYDLAIITDPLDPNTVYFGGISLYRSNDGGAQFTNIINGIHVDQHAFAFTPQDPATLYVGNDGGIFRTRNRGVSWTSLNTNLAITQFYSGVSLHPAEGGYALGGTQDNGTLEFRGSPAWDLVLGADGGFTAIDYVDPTISYAETQWTAGSTFGGPRRRFGQGSFERMAAGIDANDRALFIPPLVMDPVDPRTLYFGTFRVYRTTNTAESWTPISPDLSSTANGRVASIAPSRSSPGTIYVGMTDGTLQLTQDGGAQWTVRSSGIPQRVITDIAVDPADPSIAVAVVSGFNTGHAFRTSNFGQSWQDISGNLPDMPVLAVITHETLGADIFIGTDLGVFRSSDLGATWTPLVDGLPNVAVFDIAYRVATGELVAGTHGRGMFTFRASLAAAVVLAPDSVTLSSLGDTVRVNATALDAQGNPLPQVGFAWRSLDSKVVTVDASGLVQARGNGLTQIIAQTGGVADTMGVRVQQVAVAMMGLADMTGLVVGETLSFDANPVDARGATVEDAAIAWVSSDPTIVNVDAAGRGTALRVGTAKIFARLAALVDSTAASVTPPSTTHVTAASIAAAGPRSRAGTLLPLLRIELSVQGQEAVELIRLGFEASGDDPEADVRIHRDANGDGILDPTDPVLASFPAALSPGGPVLVTLAANGLALPTTSPTHLIVALRLSGRSPNGAMFQVRFLPGQTATLGTRSNAANLLAQPAEPVASELVQSTVLGPDEVLTLSENPVRANAVVFNFRTRPTVASVFTIGGRLVIDMTATIDDEGRFVWDLRNEEGTPIAPGVYLIIFRIDNEIFREKLLILRTHAPNQE